MPSPSDPRTDTATFFIGEPAFVISCDTCVMKDTDTCNDCMMSYLCDRPEDGAVVLDLQELREVKLLAQAGLVPTLRHRAAG